MFIKVVKDFFALDDEDFMVNVPLEDKYGTEIIRSEDIRHIYTVKGAVKHTLCYEIVDRKGNDINVYESFEHKVDLDRRLDELEILLNK